mgnify:FL=1
MATKGLDDMRNDADCRQCDMPTAERGLIDVLLSVMS